MTDISVIILTGKEEIHIRRCLEKLAPLKPRQVFVVESQRGDRTHEAAIATAKQLQWQVKVKGEGEGQVKVKGEGEQWNRRAMAEKKVAEWLAGVDDDTFGEALKKLVEEKAAAGEYVFDTQESKVVAIDWARKFFAEFSRKLIPLSDGRIVYFVPDVRARGREISNARAWAEYAFHAVSTGGKQVPGKSYFIRHFSETKCENLAQVEATIRAEHCVAVIERDRPERDAIHFVGISMHEKRFDVVTRLDEYGNANANLSEVTVVMTKKRYSEKSPPPEFRPLTEVVEAVAKHQAAGFSPSTTGSNIANPSVSRKGDVVGVGGRRRGEREGAALHLVWHDWPGLYAKQFNWALDNLPIEGAWVLRLDADEYLTPQTIEKLRSRLKVEVDNGGFPPEVSGLNIELKRRFCGGEIRHGTTGIRQARIFRYGRGRCEERAMDEHIEVGEWEKVKVKGEGEQWRMVSPGSVIDFDGAFYDDNLNDMDWWREKHRGYAKREAKDALAFARGEVHFKRSKEMYYRQPRYLRAVVYFGIRYFLKGGILDGYAGWMWNFWQGLWYRWLVDREIAALRG